MLYILRPKQVHETVESICSAPEFPQGLFALVQVLGPSLHECLEAWAHERDPSTVPAAAEPNQATLESRSAAGVPGLLRAEPDQATLQGLPDQAMSDALPTPHAAALSAQEPDLAMQVCEPDQATQGGAGPLEVPPGWQAETLGVFEEGANTGNAVLQWVLAVLQCQLSSAGVPVILACLREPACEWAVG